MIKKITKCRICKNINLVPIVDLGDQSLTGVFPKSREESITCGPLELVKCFDEGNTTHCGLVQLAHSYEMLELYGQNYGYRSGLNRSMVDHLNDIYKANFQYVSLNKSDLIIDIGSNDGTYLNFFDGDSYMLVGVDPTAKKFKSYYKDHVKLITDFFDSKAVRKLVKEKQAKVVTSIAMFYDLEDPVEFARQVGDVLDNEGIWVLEQSYMPLMLQRNAYDTICHEHLEYYGLKQLEWVLGKAGLKIIDIEVNDINGGSIKLIVAKVTSDKKESVEKISKLLENEDKLELMTLKPFQKFNESVKKHRKDLKKLIGDIRNEGKTILGFGASTKGNVILQYCGFTSDDISSIAEVNEDKYGSYTPKSHIPIIPEEEALRMNPDYFLVLPWHFKEGFIQRLSRYLGNGGHLIFPLPEIEIV
jgi:hypothetical protein